MWRSSPSGMRKETSMPAELVLVDRRTIGGVRHIDDDSQLGIDLKGARLDTPQTNLLLNR